MDAGVGGDKDRQGRHVVNVIVLYGSQLLQHSEYSEEMEQIPLTPSQWYGCKALLGISGFDFKRCFKQVLHMLSQSVSSTGPFSGSILSQLSFLSSLVTSTPTGSSRDKSIFNPASLVRSLVQVSCPHTAHPLSLTELGDISVAHPLTMLSISILVGFSGGNLSTAGIVVAEIA